MIERLTPEQEAALAAHTARYFAMATCTDPADRPTAEAAARALAEIAGVKVYSVVWVQCPQDGAAEYNKSWALLVDSMNERMLASLWSSLGASLWASLRDSLRDSLRALLVDSMWDSLWDSLWVLLRESLLDSLGSSLLDSLRDSLRDSLLDSLRDSLRYSLRDSLLDSLWNTGWVAYYDYCREELGVKYDPAQVAKLDLWIRILESCFAVWILPGTIILCERPAEVDVQDGKLVGLTWRT